VIGIANEHSIATGCATAFRAARARLATTYLNDKAEPFTRPVTDRLGCEAAMPCDVRVPGELEAVFARIASLWGSLDFRARSWLRPRPAASATPISTPRVATGR
jgi:enoyl-[acyl-carrier protein] reductase I